MNRPHMFALGLLFAMAQGCGASNAEHGSAGASSVGGGGMNSSGGSTDHAGIAGTSSGGSGPAVIPTVAACDKLGAPGVWERIGPPPSFAAKPEVVSSAVDPNHAGTAYVGINKAGLWKTTDCGANWVQIDTGKNADKLNSGSQWELFVDPATSDVYTDSGYGGGGFYRSTNGGVDFDDITPTGPGIPTFVQGFSMDPKDNKHIIVGFHDNCTGDYAPMCFAETSDGGMTYRFVKGPSPGWQEAAGPMLIGGKVWLYGVPFTGVYYTADSGATWEKVIGGSGCFSSATFAAGNWYIGCFYGIQQSADAHTWVELPNTGNTSAIVQTGNSLYSSFQNDSTGQPVWTASLDSLSDWKNVPTPMMSQGASAGNMSWDANHKVLYLPAWGAGLWRVVTP